MGKDQVEKNQEEGDQVGKDELEEEEDEVEEDRVLGYFVMKNSDAANELINLEGVNS